MGGIQAEEWSEFRQPGQRELQEFECGDAVGRGKYENVRQVSAVCRQWCLFLEN